MVEFKFDNLGISKKTLKKIEKRGYIEPTEIQVKAIPLAIEGYDVIGQSQTGTGKTMAFTIPIIEKLNLENKNIEALILCPTRELALQVNNEINLLVGDSTIKSLAIYGGESIDRQIKSLKRNNKIVVGTPGRILDHLRRKTIDLQYVKFTVLDEADEMLDMGFIEDIELILDKINDRQTMLFSATLPEKIIELSNKYLNNPRFVKIKSKQVTVERIKQYYIKVKNVDKSEVLNRLLSIENPNKAIVFCNTKKMVDELSYEIKKSGFEADGIHGDMKQQKRDFVMNQFRTGKINVLIATDVAARGLDIDDVDIVFNYDLPMDEEQYVHRIGRTARAGKEGKSYSFIFGREVQRLREIEKYSKSIVEEKSIPNIKSIQESTITNYVQKILANNNMKNKDVYFNMIKQIKQYMNLEDFLALVLEERLKISTHDKIDYKKYEKLSKDSIRKRTSRKIKNVEKGMLRFHINIGKNHGVKVGDIVGAVAGESKINGKEIGSIDIYDKYSFFEVPKIYENKILRNLKKIKIRGKLVTAERSK